MDTPTQNPDSPEQLNETQAVAAPTGTLVLVSDLPNYETRYKAAPETAARLASLLQQIVGEAVYLFDGKVIDPFGPRVIATLPDAQKAIQALLKARGDLRDYNKAHPGQEHLIDARIVLHCGDAVEEGSTLSGRAAELTFATLAAIRPLDVAVSEEVIRAQEKTLKTRPLGTFGGLAFFDVSGYERATVAIPAAEAPRVAAKGAKPSRAAAAAVAVGEPAAGSAGKSKFPLGAVAIAAAAFLVIVGIAAVVMMMRRERPEEVRVASAPALPKLDPNHRRTIIVEPFDIETAAPDVQAKTAAIRFATLASLRAVPQLEIVDEGTRSEGRITAVVRDGSIGPELVPTLYIAGGEYAGEPVLLADTKIATGDVVRWALELLAISGGRFETASQPAFAHFIDALIATNGRPDEGENAKAAAAMSLALTADPSFLPAQMFAYEFYKSSGNLEAARASARRVVEIEPRHVSMLRALAGIEFDTGNPVGGVAAVGILLDRLPEDRDALLAIARHSISSGDRETFAKVAPRLASAGSGSPVHDADFTLAAGRIDAAIGRYYDIEVEQPQNAALALKIGRIAVLRRSVEIAELELAKLEKLDPQYGYPLLKAYILAQGGDARNAMEFLNRAVTKAGWMDDPHTAAAEVHAILGNNAQVLASLRRAVMASEPTLGYIAANPLFTYIQNEPAFVELRAKIDADRAGVKAELRKAAL